MVTVQSPLLFLDHHDHPLPVVDGASVDDLPMKHGDIPWLCEIKGWSAEVCETN